MNYLKSIENIKQRIAYNKDKLETHFRKWRQMEHLLYQSAVICSFYHCPRWKNYLGGGGGRAGIWGCYFVYVCVFVCVSVCVHVFVSVLGEVPPSLLCLYIKKIEICNLSGSLLERKILHTESFAWIYNLNYLKARFFWPTSLDHSIYIVYSARFYLLTLR